MGGSNSEETAEYNAANITCRIVNKKIFVTSMKKFIETYLRYDNNYVNLIERIDTLSDTTDLDAIADKVASLNVRIEASYHDPAFPAQPPKTSLESPPNTLEVGLIRELRESEDPTETFRRIILSMGPRDVFAEEPTCSTYLCTLLPARRSTGHSGIHGSRPHYEYHHKSRREQRTSQICHRLCKIQVHSRSTALVHRKSRSRRRRSRRSRRTRGDYRSHHFHIQRGGNRYRLHGCTRCGHRGEHPTGSRHRYLSTRSTNECTRTEYRRN